MLSWWHNVRTVRISRLGTLGYRDWLTQQCPRYVFCWGQVGKTWRSVHQRSSKSVEDWEAIARWSARNWRMVQQKVAEWIRWEVRGFCRHWKLMLESTMMKDFNKNAQQKTPERWVLAGKVQTAQKYSNPHVQNILKVQVVSFSSSLPPPQVSCLFPWRLCHPKGTIDSSQKPEWFIWFIWYVSSIFYIFCTHSISFPKLKDLSLGCCTAPSCPRLAELNQLGPTMIYHEILNSARAQNCVCVCQCLIVYDWWFLQIQACPENDDKWCIGLDQSALCRCACVKESVFL